MPLDNRKISILFTIIDEHIRTAEPVASQAVLDSGAIDAGAATIRNEMYVLEEEGYLTQPHASAGRVPTESAYRLYIETIQRAQRVRLEDVAAAVRMALATEVDARAFGKTIAQLLAPQATQAIVVGFGRGETYTTGLSYLVVQPEFQEPKIMQPFSEAMDRLDETLEALNSLLNGSPRAIIGSENPFGEQCGTVASHLALPAGHTITLGIVGPMRMAYNHNFGLIETVKEAARSDL
ncbi:MAG: hypothetical protein V1723_04720 [Candidatus Uhrbacteria bacterium]